ncbi:MAG: mechanosensitive ion channel family protein [Bacteroidetes bacterium]|nr:mechanosensitive ion channel family protein [Bacteroidota bacterium]
MGVDILNFVDPIRFNLLIAIAMFVASFLIANLIASVLNKYFAKRSILGHTKFFSPRFIRFVFPFVGLYVGFRYIRSSFRAKNIFEYDSTFAILENIIFILAIAFAAVIAFRGIVFIFHKYIERATEGSAVDANITSLLSKILKLVIFVVALIIVLDRFGVNINSFIVSLGIGSLAIALAAQETLANIIAGIVILIDRPFRIGDSIKTNNGNTGTVYQIGIRSCRIITLEGKMLIVPNTELTKSSITNLSFDGGNHKIRFGFFIPYRLKIDDVKEKILENINSLDKILKEPAPTFVFSRFNLESYELILVCWCKNEDKGTLIENAVKEMVLHTLYDLQNNTEPPKP